MYSIPLQKGDRIKYEIVDIRVKHKICFDLKNGFEYQVPLCDVYINDDMVAENIDAPMVYPNDLQFWEEYQMIETNWITEFAGYDLRYDSNIQFANKEILIEFSFDGNAGMKIFVDIENGAVLDLERIVNMNGMQMSYHIVQINSSLPDISLALGSWLLALAMVLLLSDIIMLEYIPEAGWGMGLLVFMTLPAIIVPGILLLAYGMLQKRKMKRLGNN